MSNDLLIIGANVLGITAKEIAQETGFFEQIEFADDENTAPDGTPVFAKLCNVEEVACKFKNVFVAFSDAQKRLDYIRMIQKETNCKICTLISHKSYVSPSAQVGVGCMVEPMAVIGTGAVLSTGCIVSYGAIIDTCSLCSDGVIIESGATITKNAIVSSKTTISSNTVFLK